MRVKNVVVVLGVGFEWEIKPREIVTHHLSFDVLECFGREEVVYEQNFCFVFVYFPHLESYRTRSGKYVRSKTVGTCICYC